MRREEPSPRECANTASEAHLEIQGMQKKVGLARPNRSEKFAAQRTDTPLKPCTANPLDPAYILGQVELSGYPY